jgi:hypothetical protein
MRRGRHMRRNLRYVLAATVALILGATFAETYARLAIPYYEVVTSVIADLHPWRVLDLSLDRGRSNPGASLRMTGEVRRSRDDLEPAARVIIDVQVGEVIETPVVFWAVVFVWPMTTLRRRLVCVAVGIPMFLVLEAATTGCQLVHSMADASAMLAGEADPLTAWERWSRFLEAGGRFALELCAAVLTVALSAAATPLEAVHSKLSSASKRRLLRSIQ